MSHSEHVLVELPGVFIDGQHVLVGFAVDAFPVEKRARMLERLTDFMKAACEARRCVIRTDEAAP